MANENPFLSSPFDQVKAASASNDDDLATFLANLKKSTQDAIDKQTKPQATPTQGRDDSGDSSTTTDAQVTNNGGPTADSQPAPKTSTPAPAASPKAGKVKGYLPPAELQSLFDAAAQKHNVPVNILMALANQESDYNPNAIGKTPTKWGRAQGIMQYLPGTAKDLGIDPMDPAQAIDAAAKQLSDRLQNGLSVPDAIKAHFGGDNQKQWGAKTAKYGQDVLSRAGHIGDLLGSSTVAGADPTIPLTDDQASAIQKDPSQADKIVNANRFMNLAAQADSKIPMGDPDKQFANAYNRTINGGVQLGPKQNPQAAGQNFVDAAGRKVSLGPTPAGQQPAQPGAQLAATPDSFTANPLQPAQQPTKPLGPTPASQQPQQDDTQWIDATNNGGNFLTDTGHNLKIGADSAAQDMRELVGRIPVVGKPIQGALDKVDEWTHNGVSSDALLKNDVQQQTSALTPEMQSAMKKDWWNSKTGTFGDAWKDPRAYWGGIVQSLPEQALTMFPAMGMAKAAYAAKIAQGLAPEIAAKAAAKTAQIAGTISEGLLGGAQSSRSVRDQINALPEDTLQKSEAYQTLLQQPGMTPESARAALADSAASRAFLTAGVTTGLFGGFGDRMLAKMFTEHVSGNIAKRMGTKLAEGALAEGPLEEFPQSYLQQVSENNAMQTANPDIGTFDDALNQGLQGLAVGAAQGGAMGGLAAARHRAAQTPGEILGDALQRHVDAAQPMPGTADTAAREALDPNNAVYTPHPATVAAQSQATGPLTRAIENAATDHAAEEAQASKPRVNVTAPDGELSGILDGTEEHADGNFSAHIMGDDGNLYHFTPQDGATIVQQGQDQVTPHPFTVGSPAMWHGPDHDLPVTFHSIAPQPGDDGRHYAKVSYEGRESYVPLDELVPMQAPKASQPAAAAQQQTGNIPDTHAPLFDEQGRPRFPQSQAVKDFKAQHGLGQDAVRLLQQSVLNGEPMSIEDAKKAEQKVKEQRKQNLKQSQEDAEKAEEQAKNNPNNGKTAQAEHLGNYQINNPLGQDEPLKVRVIRKGNVVAAFDEDGNHVDLHQMLNAGMSMEQALANAYGDHPQGEMGDTSKVQRLDQSAGDQQAALAASQQREAKARSQLKDAQRQGDAEAIREAQEAIDAEKQAQRKLKQQTPAPTAQSTNDLSTMDEPALRERLKYIAQQIKITGANKHMAAERKRVEAEIEKRKKGIAPTPAAPAEASGFQPTHETPYGDQVMKTANGEFVDEHGVIHEGDMYPIENANATSAKQSAPVDKTEPAAAHSPINGFIGKQEVQAIYLERQKAKREQIIKAIGQERYDALQGHDGAEEADPNNPHELAAVGMDKEINSLSKKVAKYDPSKPLVVHGVEYNNIPEWLRPYVDFATSENGSSINIRFEGHTETTAKGFILSDVKPTDDVEALLLKNPNTPDDIRQRIEANKAKQKPTGRVVTVNGEQVTLTPEQEKQWDEADAEHARTLNFIEKNILNDRQMKAARIKGAGMELSAKRRQITGKLTAKEQAAADADAKKIRKGDSVTATTEDGTTHSGTVEGVAFGKVRINTGNSTVSVEHHLVQKTQPAHTETSTPIANDRRKDETTRKRIDDMSPEEMRRALLVDDLTGLGNKRAWQEAPKRKIMASIDADALKFINDTFGHDKGDELLAAIGQAMQEEGLDAYHISGDEFYAQHDSASELDAALKRVSKRLNDVEIEAQLPDGTIITKKGVGFSYGIANNLQTAEQRLQQHKTERERAGLRSSRGQEPSGVSRRAPAGNQNQEHQAAAEAAQAAEVSHPANETLAKLDERIQQIKDKVSDLEAKQQQAQANGNAWTYDQPLADLAKELHAYEAARDLKAKEQSQSAEPEQDPLLKARNDLIEMNTRAEAQGRVVDDRLLEKIRKQKELIKQLEQEQAPDSKQAATQQSETENAPAPVSDDVTKRIENSKRRLREARNAGDDTKAAAIEKEIRQLRQQAIEAEPDPARTPRQKKPKNVAEATQTEAPAVPEGQPSDFGKNNKVFTEDMAAKARAILKAKLNNLNAGFDPDLAHAGLMLAGYYIEGGLRDFASYAKAMIGDIGDGIKPYLSGFYENVRRTPGFDNAGMTPTDEVDRMQEEMLAEQPAEATATEATSTKPATVQEPKTMDEFKATLDNGDKAHYDYAGTDGSTVWIEKGEHGWIVKQTHDDNPHITHTTGGDPRGGGFSRQEAIKRAAEIADYRFNGWKPLVEPAVTDNTENQEGSANANQPGVEEGNNAGVQPPASERGNDPQHRPAQDDSGNLEAGQPENVSGSATGEPDGQAGVRPATENVGQAGSTDGSGASGNGRTRAGRSGKSNAGAGGRSRAGRSSGTAGDTASAVKNPATVSPANTGPGDFHVDDPLRITGGGQKARFDKNKAAIELRNKLMDEGRQPTKEEQEILAGYTGWGSFGQELFQGTWNDAAPKPGWEQRDQWLRDNLGKEEWEGLQRSIINAHYTDPPTVQAMWSMVQRMGFTGGRVLEPSIGIGNFFGMMPQELASRSQRAGIELDPVTGSMAQMLYPNANIQIKGYQDSKTPDGFYDLIIGNWPFANISPADRRYNRLSPQLHDYFFLKALDQTRAGGIVIGITSAGTMDKKDSSVRVELAKKGELVAAFRLPSGAFEEYAGTKVVTDIIVLRKRAEPLGLVSNEGWIRSTEHPTKEGTPVFVNEYYHAHPENVIGKIDFGHGTTTFKPGLIVHRPADMMAQLQRIVNMVPEGAYVHDTRGQQINYVTNHTNDRTGALVKTKDGLYVVQGEYLAPANEFAKYELKDPAKTAEREEQLGRLIEMRQLYGKLMEAERAGDATAERKALRDAYNAFKVNHGIYSTSYGLKYLSKIDDPFYPALAALENVTEDEKGNKHYTPAAILNESTIRGARKMDKPNVRDAFVLARNENVNPSPEQIAEIANKPVEDVKRELIAAGAAFETPGGDFVPSDIYLSGNVREKLRQAQAGLAEGNPAMQRNIEALEKVLPPDVPYYKIETQMGATWVPPKAYADFVAHMMGLPDSKDIEVKFHAGAWNIDFPAELNKRPEARSGFGMDHRKVPFKRLVRAAIANQTINVKEKDDKGVEHIDEEATKEANAKIADMRLKFGEWLWQDPVRRQELEQEYNETRNAYATPKFDGSFLGFQGMALSLGRGPFNLREHQVNAIWRALVTRKSLNAHEVGTGKTFTMGGIAIESRRYGIAKKPLMFAHNANSKSVAHEIQMMYPAAKILYVDNLNKDNIKLRMAQIANDDWDVIVLPHSLIDRIGFKEETLMAMAQKDIDDLELAAQEAAAEDNVEITKAMLEDEDELKKLRSPTAKQLVKQRMRILETIKKLAQQASREDSVAFEDMGVDMILVDEAHEFKKPPIATKMKMKGLQTQTSDRSISMSFITKYVRGMNNGGNVHLFTGTPITNTMTEVFHMMRYMMLEEMEQSALSDWDGWFGSFAREVNDVELTSTGEYEAVTRLQSFINVPELRRMIGQYMDVVFADDMPEMQPREVSGKKLSDKDLTDGDRAELLNGRTENAANRPYKKVVNVSADMTDAQNAIFARVQQLANAWRNMKGKERKEAMARGLPEVPIIHDAIAEKASFDVRLVDAIANAGLEGTPEMAPHPDSKPARVVRNLVEIYHSHPQANQVVFMEQGMSKTVIRSEGEPGEKRKVTYPAFSTMLDMIERLVQAGIPREEIATVTGATSKDRRKEIADAMNSGKIRIVFGSTDSLGVGVNMQRNLRAMHHMDAPWMPGELEQRNGRGHRQGNQWNTVMEYRYLTDRLDGRRWQVLAIKQRFITDFMKSKGDVRVIEGDAASDEQGDILSTFADAAGDPRILVKAKLGKKLEQLQSRERLHAQAQADAIRGVRQAQENILYGENKLQQFRDSGVAQQVASLIEAQKGDNFRVTIGDKEFTKRSEASDYIRDNLKKLTAGTNGKTIAIGTYGAHKQPLLAKMGYFEPQLSMDFDGFGIESNGPSLQSLENKLRELRDERDASYQQQLDDEKRKLTHLQAVSKEPFHMADKLADTEKQLSALEKDIADNPVAPPYWLRAGAPVETPVVYDGKPYLVTGHRWNNEGYYVLAQNDAGKAVAIPYMEAKDNQGMPLYEERAFTPPTIIQKKDGEQADANGEVVPGQLGAPEAPAGNQSVQSVAAAIRSPLSAGSLNDVFGRLMQSGSVIVHPNLASVPAHLRGGIGMQAVTDENDIIHLVGNQINEQNAMPVLLHEMFHAGVHNLIGTPAWMQLHKELNALFRQAKQSTGRAREFFDKGRARVEAARQQNAIAPGYSVEEFGAYTIEEYASAPKSFRKWVNDVIGTVKAWVLRRFGKQLGALTPAQLTALAAAAVRAGSNVEGSTLNGSTVQPGRRSNDLPGTPPTPQLMDKVFDNADDAYKAVGLTPEQVAKWKEAHKGIKQVRLPAVEQAAKDLNEGKITQDQYLDVVRREHPIKPFKEVPALPTVQEVTSALTADKILSGIIGATKFIPDGTQVALRLDIPAYESHDTWVVSVHDGSVNGGKVIGYGQTAVARNVEFKTAPSGAMKIATGKSAKGTIARMFGTWVNEDPEAVHARAVQLMNDPQWVQVGMNPFRHSWFYDKADGLPLLSADEVIQVGALVLAKNAVKTTPDDETFAINKHPHGVRFSVAPGAAAPAGAGSQAQSGLKPADMGLLRRVQASLQDNLNRLKQVQEQIQRVTGVKDLGGADHYGAEANRPGRIAARLENAQHKLTGPLIQNLADAGKTPEQLNELLHAMHAEERNKAIAKINPAFPDGGSGMTNAEAAAILSKYQNDSDLHALADQARKIADLTLQAKLHYGLIDQDTYDTLAQHYQYYVPLKGDGEYGPKVKRAMGHDARDEMILDNIARDFNQAIVVGEKNLARQSLLQLALQHPDPELWTVGVVPQGRYVAGQTFTVLKGATPVAEYDSYAQALAYVEGVHGGQNYTIQQSGEKVKTFVKPLQSNEVMVFVKGQPIRIQLHDEQLAQQLRPLNPGQMHPILEFMRGLNRYFSSIYTGKNPAFILKNMSRDAMTGSINMAGNYGALTAAKAWLKYPNTFAALGQWAATGKAPTRDIGRYLNEYRSQGGKIGASWMSDLEEQGKSLARMYEDAFGAIGYARTGRPLKSAKVAGRKMVGGLAHVVEVANQAAENALRLALYTTLREQGETPAKAAQAAKNVTVNFDRKGTATGALGAIYLFFNPAVQGTANAIRTIAKGDHKYQAIALLGGLAMLGFMAAAKGLDEDKDRWLGYGWDTRSRNFILHIGSHRIQIPVSQEFAPAYALGVAIAEGSRGGVSKMQAAANMVGSFMDAYFPLNNAYSPDSDNHGADLLLAATPTILKPGAQVAVNRNSFGQPIVPESDSTKDKPDNLKMYRGTKNSTYDKAAQGIASLGELMGAGKYENDISKVSPETLKMLWQTYTGGLGQFVTDSAGLASMTAANPGQVESSDIPIVKDFWKPNTVQPIRSRYYDLAKDAKAAIAEFNQAKKNDDDNEQDRLENDPSKSSLLTLGNVIRSTSKAAAQIRDEEVTTNADDSLSPAQKRAQLKDLEKQEEELYRDGLDAFKQ